MQEEEAEIRMATEVAVVATISIALGVVDTGVATTTQPLRTIERQTEGKKDKKMKALMMKKRHLRE